MCIYQPRAEFLVSPLMWAGPDPIFSVHERDGDTWTEYGHDVSDASCFEALERQLNVPPMELISLRFWRLSHPQMSGEELCGLVCIITFDQTKLNLIAASLQCTKKKKKIVSNRRSDIAKNKLVPVSQLDHWCLVLFNLFCTWSDSLQGLIRY